MLIRQSHALNHRCFRDYQEVGPKYGSQQFTVYNDLSVLASHGYSVSTQSSSEKLDSRFYPLLKAWPTIAMSDSAPVPRWHESMSPKEAPTNLKKPAQALGSKIHQHPDRNHQRRPSSFPRRTSLWSRRQHGKYRIFQLN